MRKQALLSIFVALLQITIALCPEAVHAQAGFEDDRVMLQGFYWESYRHGHPEKFPSYGARRWYQIVAEQAPAIRHGRFNLIWLPPPSFAGAHSAGYNPKEYFNLSNSYGHLAQHLSMLASLLGNGVEPVADVVINHRDGSQSWADFKNPDWARGRLRVTTKRSRTRARTSRHARERARRRGGETGRVRAARRDDLRLRLVSRHRPYSERVRRDLIRHLLQLKSAGYRGWRYDMVHGYHAKWVAVYNRASAPSFSVGEYDWDKPDEQRGWTWHTATVPGRLDTASSVFDFMTMFHLKDNKNNYAARYESGQEIVRDPTNGYPWKNRAVTFLENHDTGYRTNEDGTPQPGHESDSFANDWEVEQGYAVILTHLGVPTVYWKHYFDWGGDLRDKIRALINARKVAGVHAGSAAHPQDNARTGRGLCGAASVATATFTFGSEETTARGSRSTRVTRTIANMRTAQAGRCGWACGAIPDFRKLPSGQRCRYPFIRSRRRSRSRIAC